MDELIVCLLETWTWINEHKFKINKNWSWDIVLSSNVSSEKHLINLGLGLDSIELVTAFRATTELRRSIEMANEFFEDILDAIHYVENRSKV